MTWTSIPKTEWLLTVIDYFSTVFCIRPNIHSNGSCDLVCTNFKKLCSVVISSIMVASKIHTICFIKEKLSFIGFIMNLICEISGVMLFVNTVLGSAFWKVTEWKYFLKETNKLALANTRSLDRFDQIRLFFSLAESHACFVLILVYYLHSIGIVGHMGNIQVLLLLDFVADAFIYYFCEIFCVTICSFFIMLERGYMNLGALLLKIDSSNGLLVLKEINDKYLTLNDIVTIFNDIFGFSLFCTYITTSSQFLSWLCYEMDSLNELSYLLVSFFGVMVLYGPVNVLFFCGRIGTECEKIVNICYKLEQQESMKEMKTELAYTRSMIQKKPPLFTANNIIILKPSTLFSILSTMATYFIVVLQFK